MGVTALMHRCTEGGQWVPVTLSVNLACEKCTRGKSKRMYVINPLEILRFIYGIQPILHGCSNRRKIWREIIMLIN